MKRRMGLSLFLVFVMLLAPAAARADDPPTPGTGSPDPAALAPSPSPGPAVLESSPSPNPAAAPQAAMVSALTIDSGTLYPGMDKTYADGYVPRVENGAAILLLPLLGDTFNNAVSLTADLGAAADSPFVYGNYSQSVQGAGQYLFRLEIPLAAGRKNGVYPVALRADYLDMSGAQASQTFTVYVTVTDGIGPTPQPTDPPVSSGRQSVSRPELYIAACLVEPAVIEGGEGFTVQVKLKNIGSTTARSIRLLYGSETAGIWPAETNNSLWIPDLKTKGEYEASLAFRTTADVLSGERLFYIKLAYVDRYGGAYEGSREYPVTIRQPASVACDAVALPQKVTAGETVSLPASVFNTGKSPVRNVTVTLAGAGLFPSSSVFLGDIAPGEAKYGEMKVFIGMLSMTAGYTESYGTTTGVYTVAYEDESGEAHALEQSVKTEICQPEIPPTPTPLPETTEPVSEWWITALAGFAAILIVVALIVVSRVSRMLRLRD